MIERDDVREAMSRMSDVWPRLKKDERLRNEIGQAVWRERSRLNPSDITRGVEQLFTVAPTTAKDGGPAWPPGPREVMECVLRARGDRISQQQRDNASNTGKARRLAGRCCAMRGCHGGVDYLPNEQMLVCESCRAVQVVEWREGHPVVKLDSLALHGLTFQEDTLPEYSAPTQSAEVVIAA